MLSPEKSDSVYFDFEAKPWLNFYGPIPHTLEYPSGNMYQAIYDTAAKCPDDTAYEFMGIHSTYRRLISDIGLCAQALKSAGIGKGDKVAIILPNIPQALFAIYGANKLGAVCVMIHPLSSNNEMELFLGQTHPKAAITLNLLYQNFQAAIKKAGINFSVLCKINDCLGIAQTIGVNIKYWGKGKVKSDGQSVIYWKEFIKSAPSSKEEYLSPTNKDDNAIILYSGGTSGDPKGMALSNLNFNALALQLGAQLTGKIEPNDSMVAILPIFHGFGLGCCVHAILVLGMKTILVPRFSGNEFAKIIKKKRPSLIAGAPTMFESLLRNKTLESADLSCLKGVFSGGDKLPNDLKHRFDAFLGKHNASVRIREGYGLTETVTACMLTTEDIFRPGCVGIPFPDMLVQICEPGTIQPLKVGQDGEICLFGPTVMLGYINNDEDTKKVLILHNDGRTWLHTGDMGYVDSDGFVYFRQRIKRILKVSGYTVYPSLIEETVNMHPSVNMSCAVSIRDELKMNRVKLFVELNEGISPTEKLRKELESYCMNNLNVWSVPKEIVFCDKLPVTKVGKIDYKLLQE